MRIVLATALYDAYTNDSYSDKGEIIIPFMGLQGRTYCVFFFDVVIVI